MSSTRDVLATTAILLSSKYVDATYQTKPLLEAIGGKKATKMVGGRTIQVPVALSDHSSTVYHTSGYEPTARATGSIFQDATWEMGLSSEIVTLTKKDELENSGTEAKVNLLKARLEVQIQSFMSEQEANFLKYNADSYATYNTLDGVTAASTRGFMEEVVVASQSNTVGGIDKALYDERWTNGLGNASGAFATNGMKVLRAMHLRVKTFSKGSPGDRVLLLSDLCNALYMEENASLQRFVGKDALDNNQLDLLSSDGYKVRNSPTLGFVVGANTVSGYMFDSKSLGLYMDPRAAFTAQPEIAASEQLLMKIPILFRAQLFTSDMKALALLINGDA